MDAVSQALIARLQNVVVGDPAEDGVKMGALVNGEQRADVQEKVDLLIAAGCQVRLGGKADLQAAGHSSRRRCFSAHSQMKLPPCIAPKPSGRSPR